MNSQYTGVLQLIKSAITGKAYPLPEAFSLDKAVQIAGRHGVDMLLYYGAVNCGMDKKMPQMRRLWDRCCKMLLVGEGQLAQIARILDAFEKHGICAMPLKGTVLKHLYPQQEMRRMGDADILIRQEQYPQIKLLMTELGFTYVYETDHEIVWQHKHLHVELHKKLIPSRNKQWYAFFGDGWQLARPCEGYSHIYTISAEDTYLHLLAHIAKHYVSGGIGLQHMTDLLIYKRCHPGLDQAYLRSALQKMGLQSFHAHIDHVLDVWFAEGQPDTVSEAMTEFIFASGVYGTHKSKVLSEAAKGKKYSKCKWIRKVVFLNLGDMKMRYPFLNKWPILLPVMWVVRAVDLLLFHRERIMRKLQDIKQANSGDVNKRDAHLKLVGLKE